MEQDLWESLATALQDNPLFDEAMPKDCAEFLVQGSAFAPEGKAVEGIQVSAKLGELTKTLNIYGERYWQNKGPLSTPSMPKPFTEMPLNYQHAFGGEGYAKNPLGKGLPVAEGELRLLPNIELPNALINSKKSMPDPASFAPIDNQWQPRIDHIGTYNEAYIQEHMFELAPDIDWQHFNVAPEDQRFTGYLNGDEAYELCHMHPDMPIIAGQLPEVRARCFVEQQLRAGDQEQLLFKEVPLNLDTVYFFPNDNLGVVIHRGTLEVFDNQGADIKKLLVAHESLAEDKRSKEHYQREMTQRTDPEESYKYMLNSVPLIPVGVPCAFKLMLGDELQNPDDPMSDNIENFSNRKSEEAHAEVDKHMNEQLGKLEAAGMADQVAVLKEKMAQIPEAPEEAKQIEALMNKILPNKDTIATDLDLSQLNFDAMDEIDTFIAKLTEQKKAEAMAELEQQMDKLRASNEPGAKESLEKIEQMLKDMALPPILVRPKLDPEQLGIKKQLEDAKAQIERAKAMPELTDEQRKQLEEQEQSLDLQSIEAQLKEAETHIQDGYRQGAHFPDLMRSPYAGQEFEIAAAFITKAKSGESCAQAEIAFCQFEQIDFTGIDLTSGYLEYTELQDVIFDNALLQGAIFAFSKMTNVRFTDAQTVEANFGSTTMSSCEFTRCDFDDATFGKSKLSHCRFNECDFGERMDLFLETQLEQVEFYRCSLKGHHFIELSLRGCRFIECDLTESNFVSPDLEGANFSGSTLDQVNFIAAKLKNSVFTQAILNNTRFVNGCDLSNCNFSEARAIETNFRECQLTGSQFTQTHLDRSDFGEANISHSNFDRVHAHQTQFMKTNLNSCSFLRADLFESSLMNADLRSCQFTQANLYGVNFLESTLGNTNFMGANLDQTILKDWRPDYD